MVLPFRASRHLLPLSVSIRSTPKGHLNSVNQQSYSLPFSLNDLQPVVNQNKLSPDKPFLETLDSSIGAGIYGGTAKARNSVSENTSVETEHPPAVPSAVHSTVTTTPPVNWSSTLQTVLDQPPSSLPQRFILGGVVFCLAFGAWAWLGQMNEVGHARGKLVPQGEAYKINPLVEGKVTQLAVNEGQNVKAGQLLVALDGQIAANDVERLEQVLAGYRVEVSQKQTLLEKIRLEAKTRAAIAAANIQAQEVSIAQANANAKTASELVTQYQQDIVEYQERLQRFGPMVTAGAISREQLFEVEQSLRDRQSTTIKSRGDLQQNLAEAERLQAGLTQKHAEGRKDQLASQQQGHELEAQITDLNTKIADTQTSLSSAQSRLKQYSFYAPVDGIVSSLNIKRTGEVVQIAQTIAEIGPQHAPLVLQASLPNQEAGFVKPGMPVQVKVDAYPYQDYGIISGRVVSTSPDSKSDKNLGEVYRIEVALDRDYVSTPQQMIKFKPGQTATAEIVIRDRHIIDILLDPIRKLQKGGINL